MSTEDNKAIARRYLDETWNHRNMAVVDELVAVDFVQHITGVAPGRDGIRQFFATVHAAFPDIHTTIEDLLAEDDKVAWRITVRGTHTGQFRGIPPTGKAVAIPTIAIVRMAGGKIVEHWNQVDNLGLLQQLGVMPTPGGN